MGLTEKQKQYHLRKMRSWITRLDANRDGYISHEDYEHMSSRLTDLSGMSKEEAKADHKDFMKVADILNLKEGVKIPLEGIVLSIPL